MMVSSRFFNKFVFQKLWRMKVKEKMETRMTKAIK